MKMKKIKIIGITLAVLVAALALVALVVIGGETMASFRSAVQGIADKEVARFAVGANAITSEDLNINCNDGTNEASYQFVVSNHKDGNISEVDVAYAVKVALPAKLPNGLTMMVDGVAGTVSSNGRSYEFTQPGWVFAAGTAATQTHTLTFTADPSVLDFNIEMDKVSVSVVLEQID